MVRPPGDETDVRHPRDVKAHGRTQHAVLGRYYRGNPHRLLQVHTLAAAQRQLGENRQSGHFQALREEQRLH